MPGPTYTLIKGETIASAATSYTFTAIPSTYTDLVLRCSTRGSQAGTLTNLNIQINGDTGNTYSRTRIYGYNSTATSNRDSNAASFIDVSFFNLDGTTANTFTNTEIYLPNYTSSTNKPFSAAAAMENNSATLASIGANANLWSNTAAITSLSIQNNGGNFVSGSSFYLYGISKS